MQEKNDLMRKAWHPVDRIGAEEILSGKEKGSFFFRKDPYALLLEEQLNTEASERVTCFTISYLETSDHVVDRTLVSKAHRWYFYDDDTQLTGPSYDTLEDLLAHAGSPLIFPILN